MNDICDIIDVEENKQLRSIPAQRLIEKLSLLKNRVYEAKKRWFWELLQNASDYNESVNVKLIVSDDNISFIHDGNPFSLMDSLNLISPDSNKADDKAHADNIGKFGTGLVSTHILSAILGVEGIFADGRGKYFKFKLSLDRSCFEDKQALINQITDAKGEFKKSLKECQYEAGFNTTFSYDLRTHLPTLESAMDSDVDIEYLYAAIPYTLCFMPKVESISIQDKRHKAIVKEFTIRRKEATKNSIVYSVVEDGREDLVRFACFEREDISTVIKIESGKVCPIPEGLSRLFCGLPLIGTEETGLPIILNSLKFQPSTEREGVELEPGSNEINRQLLAHAPELYGDVLDYIKQEQLQAAFNVAKMTRAFNGTQTSRQQFINVYLPEFKNKAKEKRFLLNSKGDFISFSSLKLPVFKGVEDTQLFDNAITLNESSFPVKEEYRSWIEVVDLSYSPELAFDYSDFAKMIESKGSIYSLGIEETERIPWLLRSCKYLLECDCYVFSKYKLLPNQEGALCYAKELYSDISLSADLKMIYDSLFSNEQKKIEDCLLDKAFNEIKAVNQEYTDEMIAKNIDAELSSQYSEKQGDTTSINSVLNSLYTWIKNASLSKEKLSGYFHWYYPKRATLFVDMLTDIQREQTLTIAQSGKMEALAELATLDLDEEGMKLLVSNLSRLPDALNLILSNVDDTTFANHREGDEGERIVYLDLQKRYPKSDGFKIVWASKDRNESCFDFEIWKSNQIYAYCDAKTTVRGIANSDSIPFFLRKSQWGFLQNLDDSTPYFLARVFLNDGGQIKYIRLTIA